MGMRTDPTGPHPRRIPSQEHPMSPLVEHARRELDLCGQSAEDPAYAQSIVAAVAAFTSYGHSGASADCATQQLLSLLRYEALSPLTDSPDEWENRSEMSGQPWWQNVRDGRAMSHDGGKTYWLVNEPEGPDGRRIHTSKHIASNGDN